MVKAVEEGRIFFQLLELGYKKFPLYTTGLMTNYGLEYDRNS